MRFLTSLVIACIAITGCSSNADVDPDGVAQLAPSAEPSPSPAPSPTTEEKDEPLFPGPRARVPSTGAALAKEIETTNRLLPRVVDRWLDAGGPLPTPQPIPRRIPDAAVDLVRGSLWQQRLYRVAAGDPKLGRRVLGLIPSGMRSTVEAHTMAGRGLRSLVRPLEPPLDFKVTPPHGAHMLKDIYKNAARDYGVGWEYLAALNFVESKFGRFMGPSYAGAEGPMQFMPQTWDYYGNGGDVWDPHDAIRGAARYLVASGAPSDWRGALFAYNRSYEYVDAVMTYARNMQRDPRNFYVYYFWQVFVLTTKGDMQITGPGAVRV